MAVTYNSEGTGTKGTAASSLTVALAVTGSNRCLVVGVGGSGFQRAHSSVTHHGDSASKEADVASGDFRASIWTLINPDTGGSWDIVATYASTEDELGLVAGNFVGVNQTDAVVDTAADNGVVVQSEIGVKGFTDEMIVDCIHSGRTTMTATATEVNQQTSIGSAVSTGMSYIAATGLNIASTKWVLGGSGFSDIYSHVGICLEAAAAVTPSGLFFVGASAMVVGTDDLTPTLPTGWAEGDLLMIHEGVRFAGSVTSPTVTCEGYTQRGQTRVEVGAQDLHIYQWYKVATSSESNPTLVIDTVNAHSAFMTAWRGIDTSSPFDVADAVVSTSAASRTYTPTGLSTATDNAVVLSFVISSDDNALGLGTLQNFSYIAGGADYDDTTGADDSLGIAAFKDVSHGAVTCPTWTQSINYNDAWCGVTEALKPSTTGAALAPNIYDTVTVSENISKYLHALFASVVQSINVTDVPSWNLSPLQVNIYEQVAASESLSEFFDKLSKSLSDLVQVSEFVDLYFPTLRVSVSDLIATSESVSLFLDKLHVDINDTVNVSEALSLFLDELNASTYDAVEVSEAVTALLTALYTSAVDNVAVSEDLAAEVSGIIENISGSTSDTVAVSEFLAAYLTALFPSAVEQVAVSELVQLVLTVLHSSLSESVEVSEYVNLYLTALHPEISDQVAVSEAVTVTISVIEEIDADISDNITVQEAITIFLGSLNQLIYDSIAVSESVTVRFAAMSVSLFDAISVSEYIKLQPLNAAGMMVHVNDRGRTFYIRARDRDYTIRRRGFE